MFPVCFQFTSPLASLPASHCLYSFYLLPVLVHTAIASSASGLKLQISSMAALWHFHCRFIPCSPALFLTELLSSPSSYSHIVYSHLPSHRLCFSLITCLYWFSPTENCYLTFFFLPYLVFLFLFLSESCSFLTSSDVPLLPHSPKLFPYFRDPIVIPLSNFLHDDSYFVINPFLL